MNLFMQLKKLLIIFAHCKNKILIFYVIKYFLQHKLIL